MTPTALPDATLAVPPPADTVARLVGGSVASRIAAGDTSVWPAAARPGWVDASRGARPLVGEIEGLRERLRVAGTSRIVLAATGGVGVAAELLAASHDAIHDSAVGARLIVLDGTDPVQVADALAGDLDATALVVSAPPGEDTAAVELLWDTVDRAFRDDGLDASTRTIVVAAPGSPLVARAGTSGSAATVVLGPPDVDGPWAALTAFALVPAGLAGTDVGPLLADAATARDALARDEPGNPALAVGALLAAAPVVALDGQGAGPLAEWVAQIVAGGLGKDGRGPLPVVVETAGAPGWDAPDALTVGFGGAGSLDPGRTGGSDITAHGSAAAQLLLWQHATAVAAHLLGVDPTDRPDTADRAAGPAAAAEPSFVDGMVEVHAGPWLPPGTTTVAGALQALLDTDGEHRMTPDAIPHITVHAYLDPHDDASAAILRPELARRTGLLTTFGWAPRCLPGGGQRDKGGPGDAIVCQLTGAADSGDDTGFGGDAGDGFAELAALQQAHASADAAALERRGRRVLRLHLTDRVVGLVTLVRAVQEL